MKQSVLRSTPGICVRLYGATLAMLVSLSAVAAPPALEIAGSTTLAPALRATAATLQQSRNLLYRVRAGGSENALRDLAAGRIDVAMVSRALRSHEARDFHSVEIARDNIAVIVNSRNPVARLDSRTLQAIFSLRIANWPEAGGPPGIIVPVVRGTDHGTRAVFDEAAGTGNLIPAGVIELNSNAAMVMYVAADPQAIGYASNGAVAEARQRGLQIHTLLIDGFSPEMEDRYPLRRPLLLVTRRDSRPRHETATLIEYLKGGAGKALLASYGFTPSSR